MAQIDALRTKLNILNSKFNEYESEIKHHAGWKHGKDATQVITEEYLQALSVFVVENIPHTNNAIPLCDIAVSANENFEQIIQSSSLAANVSSTSKVN